MANLTLAIEDQLLQDARKLAFDRGTTVNRMVREFLAQVGQASRRGQAGERLLQFRFRAQPPTWTRDDLYRR